MGGAGRWAVGALVVAVAAGTAAAAGLGGIAPGDPDGRLGGVPEPIVTEPGGPLADGVEVPAGLRLVGGVFPIGTSFPDGVVEPGWAALLEATGNPFDAWDALVDELGQAGVDLPGSATACQWYTEADGYGQHRDLTGAGAPPGTVGLWCRATYVGGEADDGTMPTWLVQLSASAESAWAGIEVDPEPGGTSEPALPTRAPAAEADRRDVRFAPRPEAVGREAIGPVRAEPGELLPANLCGDWSGVPPLRVPPGSRVVASAPGSPVFEVLGPFVMVATVDAEAAVRWFHDQLVEGGLEGPTLERQVGADGAESWVLEEADGIAGSCTMRTSADGRAILIGRVDRD
jgi:hypothetical protein